MLRFACSPTADLSLESLRLALMNFVVAMQRNEGFVIRIEDTDQKRNIEGKDAEIVALLELFGITYKDVLYQSKNFKFHSAMAIDLLHRKKAFNCFCSLEELEAKKKKAKEQKRLYSYDGSCEQLPAEEVIDNPKPFTVRIKKPTKNISFVDRVQGELSFSPEEVDSFVILNVDKTPTYDFATAVDDMLSDISVVISSEEQIESAPKQIHVRSSLGYDKAIEYAHLPPMLEADTDIKSLLQEGFLPQAIANYLLTLGTNDSERIFTLEEAKEHFNLAKIGKTAVKFDKERLREINKEHLLRLDDKELSRFVGFADAQIGALAKLFVDSAGTTRELKREIQRIFSKKEIPQKYASTAATLKKIICQAPYFGEYENFIQHLKKESALEERELLTALQLLISGSTDKVEPKEIYPHIKNYIKEIVSC